MKRVLISYFSRTGKTQQMAEYIAEGLRITGQDVEIKKISDIKSEKELAGYDGYVFGAPTYHRTIPGPVETFHFLAQKANLAGKVGGAFGSYTHSGDAPKIIFDTMEFVYKMKVVSLGSFNLLEHLVETREGMKSCHDYGKAIGEMLAFYMPHRPDHKDTHKEKRKWAITSARSVDTRMILQLETLIMQLTPERNSRTCPATGYAGCAGPRRTC